ncbi:hypothetical protein AB6A40_000074 [Gnathostoma spinigerum]|uniref:Uncharacterized protein n=1 Tax=Gnathostoma spinigerum TaxID=75299 RepID=A0ABD6EAP0_9BILA
MNKEEELQYKPKFFTKSVQKGHKQTRGPGWYYLQYCLVTGLYMLEPWERALFNAFVVALMVAVGALTFSVFRFH